MAHILHIINGDATLKPFTETGLDGDILVWREVLSEGPLAAQLNADFWQRRSEFICKAFNGTPEGYEEKVIHELAKINQPYTEINFWFEFDLHCQVNLLGVMQLLQQQADLSAPSIYLICPDRVDGVDDFIGMGILNADQLENLYDTRLQLTDYDFTIANEAWQLYIAGDADRMQDWLEEVPFWGGMPLLKPAMQAHVDRLQVNEQGLNLIEEKLLSFYERGIHERPALHQQFWNYSRIYGMGDAELDIYLDRLINKRMIVLESGTTLTGEE